VVLFIQVIFCRRTNPGLTNGGETSMLIGTG